MTATLVAHPFEVRSGPTRPDHAVYMRRRLCAGLLVLALCTVFGVTARMVLADRGGVPASTPAIRPAAQPVPAVQPAHPLPATGASAAAPLPDLRRYIVQPGDTLWEIADRFHGHVGRTEYLERLVSVNGGARVEAGQVLPLP